MDPLRLGGLISGMDTEDVISKLMAIERRPVELLENQKGQLQAKREAWNRVNTALVALDTKLEALRQADTFLKTKATVGDSSVAQVSVSTGAPLGERTLEVLQLARAHVVGSWTKPSATDALGLTGRPVINGKTLEVVASDSLETLATKINSLGAGVTASVIRVDSTSFQLVVKANQTGVANKITMTDDGGVLQSLGLTSNTLQVPLDAHIRIDSVDVWRSSNTISDAVNGVTFELKGLGTTQVKVEMDDAAVVSAVKAFVEEYNKTVDAINAETSYDSTTKKAGALFGEISLLGLQSQIRRILSDVRSGDVGITTVNYAAGVGAGGHLKLDEQKLLDALQADRHAVMRLFGAERVNVALASAGAQAAGLDDLGNPNEYDSTIFAASGAINGDKSADRWGTPGGGWNDATSGIYPDYLQITFAGQRTIDTVNVYTLDSSVYPAGTYGIRDFRLQYWDGVTWVTLSTVTGNTAGMVQCRFKEVTTDRIRIAVDRANGTGDYSRITEVEVFQKDSGLASAIGEALSAFTGTGGVIKGKQETIDKTVNSINQRIETWQRRLELREQTLRRQFNAMEVALNKLRNQNTWLNMQLSNLIVAGDNKKW
ncbi:MAG TPA: flagellar filament capping protein FliD [Firmicutes bacterium]|nr:flagellar filament capping protein FliD [Bacillota bacterium]